MSFSGRGRGCREGGVASVQAVGWRPERKKPVTILIPPTVAQRIVNETALLTSACYSRGTDREQKAGQRASHIGQDKGLFSWADDRRYLLDWGRWMVLVSSSCPPSRGCTHVLEHFLSPILQLKAFQFWKSKFWMENLGAWEWEMLMICISVLRALKRVEKCFTIRGRNA